MSVVSSVCLPQLWFWKVIKVIEITEIIEKQRMEILEGMKREWEK